MSWSMGFALWIGASLVVGIFWSIFMSGVKRNDPDEWDSVADQKRRNERNARRQSREFQ